MAYKCPSSDDNHLYRADIDGIESRRCCPQESPTCGWCVNARGEFDHPKQHCWVCHDGLKGDPNPNYHDPTFFPFSRPSVPLWLSGPGILYTTPRYLVKHQPDWWESRFYNTETLQGSGTNTSWRDGSYYCFGKAGDEEHISGFWGSLAPCDWDHNCPLRCHSSRFFSSTCNSGLHQTRAEAGNLSSSPNNYRPRSKLEDERRKSCEAIPPRLKHHSFPFMNTEDFISMHDQSGSSVTDPSPNKFGLSEVDPITLEEQYEPRVAEVLPGMFTFEDSYLRLLRLDSPMYSYSRKSGQRRSFKLSPKREWCKNSTEAAKLHRVRYRLGKERDELRRMKQAIKAEKRFLERAYKRYSREGDRSHCWRLPDYDGKGHAQNYDTRYDWKDRSTATGRGRARFYHDLNYEVAFEEWYPGHVPSSYAAPTSHQTQDLKPMPTPPSAAMIKQACVDFKLYNSAWALFVEKISTEPPYPTSTLRPDELLGQFPSYITLPHDISYWPSPHLRIQFHTMAFFLRPLGYWPLLEFTDEHGEPLHIPSKGLKVDAINSIPYDVLETLRELLRKELRWHPDKVRRNKEYSKLLDSNEALFEVVDDFPKRHFQDWSAAFWAGLPENRQATETQKLTHSEIQQGVWDGVRTLTDAVKDEMEKREVAGRA